jgi:hypothetical protein
MCVCFIAETPAETVLSSTISKHLNKIKSCGGNKVLSSRSKKKSPTHPESADHQENLTETLREDRAKALRNEGNAYYRDGCHAAAQIAYTKCIGAACKPLTKAMAYANRLESLNFCASFSFIIKILFVLWISVTLLMPI